MFSFDPKDANDTISLLHEGLYDAEIVEAELTTSKAGNSMIHMSVRVFTDETMRFIHDYIVNPHSLWKLKRICDATGIDFDGELDEQLLIGRYLRVRVKVRVDKEGKYGDKNVITQYHPTVETPTGTDTGTTTTAVKATSMSSDSVPF
jgi:hypothetical protein